MEPKIVFHYHISMDKPFHYKTPSKVKTVPIDGAAASKQVFPDGTEILNVFHNGIVDIYSDFQLNIVFTK